MCVTSAMRRTVGTRRGVLTILLLVVVSLGACTDERVSRPGDELSATLIQIRQSNASAWDVEVPGIGASVGSGTGEVVSAVSGAADPPGATALQSGDRFHVGSVTKTFTAALILMLDQEGKLSLDSPISNWIQYPGGDEITVRMLLGHTSGIPDFTDSPDLTRRENPEQAVALAAEMSPLFAPGASWSYSNTNYTMLGMISEIVSSESWERQVVAKFIEPLDLDSTYLWSGTPQGPTVTGSRQACGYPSEPECIPTPGLATLPVVDGEDWTLAWAAGSLVSTPADLANWMAQLVGGDVLDDEHRRLMMTATPQSEIALANLPAFGPTRWSGMGLGLMRYEVDGVGSAWGHEGTINGFVANAAYFTKPQVAVAVTSNFAMADSFAALGQVAVQMTRDLR